MSNTEPKEIRELYTFIEEKGYPCIGAKASVALDQMKGLVVPHMACPAHDHLILNFLYSFVDSYRADTAHSYLTYYSAAVVFQQPVLMQETMFDTLLWQRLQALANLDAEHYAYDTRVEADPDSPNFSFSLKEEAFLIIGLHPGASREARRFKYPALIFNLHEQFDKLRKLNRYETMKKTIRRRDKELSGASNPMLSDFGSSSEVYQYSGRRYDKDWRCPLTINHGKPQHHSTP